MPNKEISPIEKQAPFWQQAQFKKKSKEKETLGIAANGLAIALQ